MRNTIRVLSLGVAACLLAVPTALEAQGRQIISTGGRGSATLSAGVRVGDIVYASGQLPARGDSTIEAQTTSTLENVKRVFEAAGTNMNNAVSCTVYLIDVKDFQGMNSAYARFWSAENPPPARATVVVAALVVPTAKLEIGCIAAMPK